MCDVYGSDFDDDASSDELCDPATADIGLAPPQQDGEDIGKPSTRRFFLEFEATQAEPELEKIFLAQGGALTGAAARSTTDFAVSGSTTSVWHMLSDTTSTTVRIPISADVISEPKDMLNTVEMDHRVKLLACGSRLGASINGSLGSLISGQGANCSSPTGRTMHSATFHVHTWTFLTFTHATLFSAIPCTSLSLAQLRFVNSGRYLFNMWARANWTNTPSRDGIVG